MKSFGFHLPFICSQWPLEFLAEVPVDRLNWRIFLKGIAAKLSAWK